MHTKEIVDFNQIIYENNINKIPIEKIRLTDIYIPSGKIVVTDPLVIPDLSPLNRKINPGKYPVILNIAKSTEWGDRVAIVVMKILNEKAVKFEPALRDGNKDGYSEFSVDSGLCAIYDEETAKLYEEFEDNFYENSPNGNIYDDFFADLFKLNAQTSDPKDVGDWLDFKLPNGKEHNMAMFQSGFGDGSYPVYWGIDSTGNICSIVIDFNVILLL